VNSANDFAQKKVIVREVLGFCTKNPKLSRTIEKGYKELIHNDIFCSFSVDVTLL
jgi:hypothetical protein